MYWRHVVASTLPEREEFACEEVNNPGYQDRHFGLIFDEGFSFSGFERDKCWLKLDDQYLDVSAISGADDDNDGRSLCLADFDDDGDLDMFVHNIQRERHMLYRNDVANQAGHGSVKVQLHATGGQWQAAGAVVRATRSGKVTAQVMSLGSGFLSQNAPELVFGTGDDDAVEIRVQWPGRAEESFGVLKAGGRYLLTEGTGEATDVARVPCQFQDPAHAGLKIKVGDLVPAFTALEPTSGKTSTVALTGRDRKVLVNFWATYCKPCVAELPDLAALSEGGDYQVILISMDSAADHARAEALLEKEGIHLERYFANQTLVDALLDPDRMPLPTSLFFDEEGRLTEVLQAPIHDWAGFRRDE